MDSSSTPPNFPADTKLLGGVFSDLTGAPPKSIIALIPHASDRRIYRLVGPGFKGKGSTVGVINRNTAENEAFVHLAHHFKQFGLATPEVLHFAASKTLYLLEDLGDETLLDRLKKTRLSSSHFFPESAIEIYKDVLKQLTLFQIGAGRALDFSCCYPESTLSEATLMRDMQGFSVELLSRVFSEAEYDSVKKPLIQEFSALTHYLSTAPSNYFLYRDFQSRNIMLVSEKPYFIDFQGGRKGPLQYDVVSLLYQASAEIPQTSRNELIEFYLNEVDKLITIDKELFKKQLSAFIVARMLQVLGVYGLQGLGAGKQYFAKSIPSAVATALQQIQLSTFPLKLPVISQCLSLVQEKRNDPK